MLRALLLDMTPGKMDDGGMYAWAGILTAIGLAASYVIAVAWHRRKAAKKDKDA